MTVNPRSSSSPTRRMFANQDARLSAACRAALTADQKSTDAVDRAWAAWPVISRAAAANGADPRMVGAIGIHESNFEPNAVQHDGMGRGAFQIDIGQNTSVGANQAKNLAFGANFTAKELHRNMGVLAARFPQFTQEQLLQATAASHNFFTSNIRGNPNTIDVGTTGGNYGRRVLDLMQCFPPR